MPEKGEPELGLFNKKKNADTPTSVLSESEIQKKLYGEFNAGEAHSGVHDREHFQDSLGPMKTREIAPEKEPPQDLFAVQKETLPDTGLPLHEGFTQQKPADPSPRYVPLQEFERKPVASSEVDPYSRFRYNRPQESRMEMFMGGMKGLGGKLGEWFHVFLDPKRSNLRRPFYWGFGILVVVLLFLGVNALNSQREEAMRERYKLRGEGASVEVPAKVAEKVALVSTPVVEREVVITPAPVRPKKLPTTDGGEASSAQTGGPFVIQVVTYPTKQDADQVVGTLAREGFRAFVKEDIRPTGRVFYLVLIGGFRSEAEAQAQLLKFRAKEIARPFQDAFIKSSRS